MTHFKFIVILVATTLIFSCKKDEQATGVGDAMIIAKQSGTNTVYGILLFAYTFSTFQSVKVTNSVHPEKIYSLNSNQGYKTNFYYETPETDFTTTKPDASTFNFSAVFENGITQEFQDELSDKVLPIPNLEQCEYDSEDHLLVVKWTPITGASSYSVNILDGSNLIFGSTELKNTTLTFSISSTGGGWAVGSIPESGKTYKVRLYAYLYEPNGGSYDIQAISYVETSIVWGN